MAGVWPLVVPAALVLLSVGLIWWHFHQWDRFRQELTEPRDRDYYRRRLRRRVQTSGMVGALGVLMGVGLLIPPRQFPNLFVFLWIGALLLLLWIVLLALADWLAAHQYHARLRHDFLVRRAVLEAQAKRAREELDRLGGTNGTGRNGKQQNASSPQDEQA